MHPHSHNDWGKSHPAETVTGGYNDGVFAPLMIIVAVVLMTYYAVAMMRRQM